MTEQEQHSRFEKMCGGPTNAFHLLHIWQGIYDNRTKLDAMMTGVSKHKHKENKFRNRAKRENYTDSQINCFLSLQT